MKRRFLGFSLFIVKRTRPPGEKQTSLKNKSASARTLYGRQNEHCIYQEKEF
jgi:hypothetical protein